MTVQDFRDLLKAQPFQPFRIVMSSGESYEVRHPEMAFLSRTSSFRPRASAYFRGSRAEPPQVQKPNDIRVV